MIYTLYAPQTIKVTVDLPASKSISNRMLIMNALPESPCPIRNLSDSSDTRVLEEALRSTDSIIDIGAAGTSMRFLTAYFAQKAGERILTGSERMRQRPIGILVEALRSIGAEINYSEKEGFPPLKIKGKKLVGGKIRLDGSVSSQYISALMMTAPLMKKGLEIELIGDIISEPYIKMTSRLMQSFGVLAERFGNIIRIKQAMYSPVSFSVENDWSAASYWYEIGVLSGSETAITLLGLVENSIQGDSRGRFLFEKLGVESSFQEDAVLLEKITLSASGKVLEYNFINEPDLAQTFVVTCCLKDIPFRFSGLQSLRIKETDRISALQKEMQKLGYVLETSDSSIEWKGEKCPPEKEPVISTYEDHRMAMAFAPAALKFGSIRIENPDVVAKSYPRYWDDLRKAGFTIVSSE